LGELHLKLLEKLIWVSALNIVMAVGEKDIEKCLQIARGLPEWFNEAGLRAMERELREEKTFVAIEGEEVLGFVAIKPLNEKAVEILWIAVKRELRGRGIGTELLRFVEEWARRGASSFSSSRARAI
jgi:GNAT superfamily N-acetyltransferase